VALKVLRRAGAYELMTRAATAAQTDHQQVDFLAKGRQLVNGNAIHRATINAIEFRQTLARLAQKPVHTPV
jgi:hypothetical protein